MPSSVAVRPALVALALLAPGLAFPGPAAAQAFGGAAAVSGEEVLIGEFESERHPGVVYVYRPGADGWGVAAELAAPDGRVHDRFGRALATHGGWLLAGAPTVDEAGRGAAYLYRRGEDGGWDPLARWQPDDLAEGDSFGRVVAIGEAHALVSALAGAEGRGAVYAYHRTGADEWEPAGRLAPADAAPGDAFGGSIAVEGDLALVGSPGEDERAGAAYLFRWRPEEGWRQITRLRPPPGDSLGERSGLGAAVAFAGEELLVGAPGADRFSGRVYRFARDAESGWSAVGRIEPAAPEPGARFGAAVAARGETLLVGVPGAGERGRVAAFRRTAGGWASAGGLSDPGPPRGGDLGRVLAVGDRIGVAGAPADDFGAGTALVLERAAGGWEPAAKVWSEQKGLPAVTGGTVRCEEGAAGRYDCEGVDLLAFLPREEIGAGRGARLNDVWGWTDPRTGREYAIVGRMDGTSFVDVSDPSRPVYLGALPPTAGSRPNTWRDMKVYDDHVFIVADGAGQHGMQVFDLRRLRAVTDPPVTFEETARYDRIASAHNIVINEGTGFAYAVGASGGGDTCGGGLHAIDIREPAGPTFAGCFAHEGTGRTGTGYSHDAQCVVYAGPDAEHRGKEICIGANETALSIADVTDKSRPVPLSTATYPNVGYAHQGWLTEDHRYFYSNDELDELNGQVEATRTLIWDVTDLDDPTLLREYYSPTKVTDHNLYVKGDRLYMSNNRSGLRVVDISDPESPVEIGHFDTTPWSEDEAGFDGTWSVYPYFESGTILLSSRREGLFLVKPVERRLVP